MSDLEDKDYAREFTREPIRVKAEIMIDGGWQDCVITNISPFGARLYAGLKANLGTAVSIKIGESGKLSATVIWIQGDEIGVKFDDDQSEMARVLIELALHQ